MKRLTCIRDDCYWEFPVNDDCPDWAVDYFESSHEHWHEFEDAIENGTVSEMLSRARLVQDRTDPPRDVVPPNAP